MRLGKYFTREEFERSATALKYGIDNTMTEEQIENAKALVKYVLDPLREHLGRPVIVSSGSRSEKLNSHPKVRGSKTSQHKTGEAADIKVDTKAFEYIRDCLPFDQLIWEFGDDNEPAWVHVSYKKHRGNRHQVLKAVKQNGKTKYIQL